MQYIAYTDGSYVDVPGVGGLFASAASIARCDGTDKTYFTKVSNDKQYLSLRNIAGEICAVMMVMEHCLNVLNLKQEDEVIIYHDYVGIANWCKSRGEPDYWQCKKTVTQAYRDYINTIVRPRFKVTFVHVKGHSGNKGNTEVDALARDAIKKYVDGLMEN